MEENQNEYIYGVQWNQLTPVLRNLQNEPAETVAATYKRLKLLKKFVTQCDSTREIKHRALVLRRATDDTLARLCDLKYEIPSITTDGGVFKGKSIGICALASKNIQWYPQQYVKSCGLAPYYLAKLLGGTAVMAGYRFHKDMPELSDEEYRDKYYGEYMAQVPGLKAEFFPTFDNNAPCAIYT